jgi:hypothetical protein
MTNKLLLSTLIASSFFIAAQANAVDGTGTAKITLVTPLTVAEKDQMEFGNIDSTKDDTCSIDTAGALTGNSCIAGGNAPVAGSFDITGENRNISLSAAASGPAVAGVVFAPALDSASATITGNALNVKVGGTMTITAASAVDGAYNLGYTLTVTYL